MSATPKTKQDYETEAKKLLTTSLSEQVNVVQGMILVKDKTEFTAFQMIREMLKIDTEKTLNLMAELFFNDESGSVWTITEDNFRAHKEEMIEIEEFIAEILNKLCHTSDCRDKVRKLYLRLACAQIIDDHDLPKAYYNYEIVYRQDPKCGSAIFGLAYCKTWQNQYREALELFNKYEKVETNIDSNAYWHKGYCCFQINDFENAKNSFQKYLDTTHENDENEQFRVDAYNYLGYAAAQLNDLDLASKSFENVLEEQPKNIAGIIGRNLVVEKRGFIAEKKKLIVSTQGHLKTLFTDVSSGLKNVAQMYIIQFGIGVFFILLAIILAAVGINTLISGLSGAAGIIITVVSLVSKAPVDLQRNRVNSAQWMIAYSNWINALYIVNSATDKIASSGKEMTWEQMKQMQDYLTQLTNETIRNMKTYCVIEAQAENSKEPPKPDSKPTPTPDSTPKPKPET